jgi:hypothetical protein
MQFFVGGRALPAIDQHEALSAAVAQFLFILPFFLSRQFFRTSADITDIIAHPRIAGLLYSPLMLFEVRMSPRLHRWVYGDSVISFSVETRYDGFRPTVFMTNGLVVAFFTMTSVRSGLCALTDSKPHHTTGKSGRRHGLPGRSARSV